MSHEEERHELNQLTREVLLLNTEIETAQTKLQARLDLIKIRARKLWKKIDDKLNGE